MNTMEYAPVVLFVYNRPKHTQKTLESLNKCELANKTDLYIYSDSARNDVGLGDVLEVRKYIEKFSSEESVFPKVQIVEASTNKGLAKSIIGGVSEVISNYKRVIVLEDDLEVATDFLVYMNTALDFYEHDSSIWSISGYTFPLRALRDYPHDVYFSGRGCSWGWATWMDRWQLTDWDVEDYSRFKHNVCMRHGFSRWGKDLPTMLDAYMYGQINSWAIRWCYSAYKLGKYTVYPKCSRVKNHGTDGSGTNFTSIEKKYDTMIEPQNGKVVFRMFVLDERIRREFACKFLTPIQYVKVIIRWALIRSGLLKIKSKRNGTI